MLLPLQTGLGVGFDVTYAVEGTRDGCFRDPWAVSAECFPSTSALGSSSLGLYRSPNWSTPASCLKEEASLSSHSAE